MRSIVLLAAIHLILIADHVVGRAADAPATAATPVDSSWLTTTDELISGPLIPGLQIQGDTDAAAISSVAIRLSEFSSAGGPGEITFNRRTLQFNEFGDADVAAPADALAHAVTLAPVDIDDGSGEGRRLFSVRFADGSFLNRLYVVLSPGPQTRSQLLVVGGSSTPAAIQPANARVFLDTGYEQIIPLWTANDRQRMASVARSGQLRLRSGCIHWPGRERPVSIDIRGNEQQQVALGRDPNLIQYNSFGDIVSTTLMAFRYVRFDVRKRDIPDPQQQGRTILDFIPAAAQPGNQPLDSHQFALVLGSRCDDSDRLLIRQNGQLTHVLPLLDDERREFLKRSQELANSPAELDFIRRERILPNDRLRPTIEGGHITGLQAGGEVLSPEVLSMIGELPHLRSLHLVAYRERESLVTLQQIDTLSQLEHLSFYLTPVDDLVLQHVGQLRKLRSLRIYDESTAADPNVDAAHITDNGLKSIRELPELTRLSLYGPGVTDAGLENLATLPKLDSLHLQRTAVTLAGLVRFVQEHPLAHVNLNSWHSDTGSDPQWLSFEMDQSKQSAILSGSLADDGRLAEVGTLTGLHSLRIESRNISNAGLLKLAAFRELESLSIDHNKQITAAGLKVLAEMPQLSRLSLWYCEQIDDDVVDLLTPRSSLKEVNLGGTAVSMQGLARLRAALPECKFSPE